MIKIIGCNNHLGVNEKGLTKNIEALKNKLPNLELIEVEEIQRNEINRPTFKNEESIYHTAQSLASVCDEVIKVGNIPLNILGDHSASIATCGASSNNTKELGILWVDAHSDINTPTTTPSGNIHGMTNAISLNLFKTKLNNILFDGPKVKPENLSFIGLRDIDPGELNTLRELNIDYYTYDDVKEKGLDTILKKLNKKFKETTNLHISIDMDSMNPELVPGVSVPVEDGFKSDDVKTIIDILSKNHSIIGIDIVEYNPDYDIDNRSLNVLIDLIQFIKDHLD